MAGKFIDIKAKDGGTFQGYLALPPSGKGPGLMIMQEIFGVNVAMRATADYFAEEGYVVLVPDMFWRIEPRVDLDYSEAGRTKAFEHYGKFDRATAIDDMAATVDHLKSMDEVKGQGKGGKTQVGCLGYCLGGALAYQAAAHAGVDCAASYYGVAIEKLLDDADKITCPVVFHFGSEDSHVPQEAVEEIRKKFEGRDEILARITPTTDYAALKDADMVIEAVGLERVNALLEAEAERVYARPEARFVSGRRVNLRSGPSTHHEVVSVLPEGTPVFPESEDEHWVLVRTAAGSIGWVYDTLLSRQ